MLTQAQIDYLLNELKRIESTGLHTFPNPGGHCKLDLASIDGKDQFIVDINRKGKIKISKCTFQNRYRNDIILLRLDIDGSPHTNPDGMTLTGNHIHIYQEGYGDSWAYPIPDIFTDTKNLLNTLIEFLKYCKVVNIFEVSFEEGIV